MITTKTNRDSRFSIRATRKQKEMIARAAAKSNKTISEFVLENAIEAAEAVGAEGTESVRTFKPIYQIFDNLSKTISAEEWQKLPEDGAENHDHYLYGSPKQDELEIDE
jgi:uncharacterized protein (DUF1778 family)